MQLNNNMFIYLIKIINILILAGLIIIPANALDVNMSPETYRAYGKQQIKTKNEKGNTILITPNYSSYADRNNNLSEKVVAIYDKRSPAYGYRYIIYTPIGRYIGHRKILQPSLNGYGYDPIPDGGDGSETPCFESIEAAKKYYYPEYYR